MSTTHDISVGLATLSEVSNMGPFITWNGDETSFFIMGSSDDTIYEYSVSVAGDLTSTITYERSVALPVSNESETFVFMDSGTKICAYYWFDDSYTTYTLSTAYDISSTITFVRTTTLTDSSPDKVMFNPAGTRMFCSNTNSWIEYYDLSTAWDTSTAGARQQPDIVRARDGFHIADDGVTVFAINDADNQIKKWVLHTPWDVSAASDTGEQYVFTSYQNYCMPPTFSKGLSCWTSIDIINDEIHQYSLSSPGCLRGDMTISYMNLLFSSGDNERIFDIPDNLEADDIVYFWCHKDDDTGGGWFVSSSDGGSADQGFTQLDTLASTAYNDMNSGLLRKVADASEPTAGTQWHVQTSDSDGLYVYMIVVRGGDPDDPEESYSPSIALRGNTLSPASTSMSTITDGSLILTGIGTDPSAIYTAPTDGSGDTDAYTIMNQTLAVGSLSAAVAGTYAGSTASGVVATWGGDNNRDDHHVVIWRVKPAPADTSHDGTGDIDSGSSSVTGAGSKTASHSGTGAMLAGSCTMAGAGSLVVTHTGTADLDSDSASITSQGIRISSGTGAINADVAYITGAGNKQWQGVGDLYAQTGYIAGVGNRSSAGTGALLSAGAEVHGATRLTHNGVGALQAEPAGYLVKNSEGVIFEVTRNVVTSDG